VYADRKGNIGLQTSAGIPIRREGGILVYPGDTSLYDWLGMVPFEELPYSYNPDCGYVSSANNKTVDDSYPYYIGSWFALPHRIGRIREMLEEKELFDTEDFKRMLRDQHSHFARDYVPIYLDALEGNTDSIYSEAMQILSTWDYQMAASSPAALISEILWIELSRELFQDELGEEHYALLLQNSILIDNLVNRIRITGESGWCDNVHTPGVKETFYDNIESAFQQAVDTLSSLYGPDPKAWQWGDLHQLTLMHPMGSVAVVDRLFKVNRGPYPIGGSSHTVCPYAYPKGRSFTVNHGASERHIFHTADWDKSLTVIPTGTSGVPASPHYLDQTELYIQNKFHKDHFSREAVEAHVKYTSVFQ
jgi:penicillin amidase